MSSSNSSSQNVIYQYSTINALSDGYYEGEIDIATLKKYGNFGLGTFNGLDGEMVIIDNHFYKVSSDGIVKNQADNEKTPFAVVTDFKTDKSFSFTQKLDLIKLEKYIETNLDSKNIFYAVKIQGKFEYLKTRSIPKQSKPYPRLIDASKKQNVFEFNNINGVLVGFYFPNYMQDINVAGFHLHFLSDDKSKGGHLLNCITKNINVEIDAIHNFQMLLPKKPSFFKLNLSTPKSEIDKIERDNK
jgi:acetolactate decarboxylase